MRRHRLAMASCLVATAAAGCMSEEERRDRDIAWFEAEIADHEAHVRRYERAKARLERERAIDEGKEELLETGGRP